MEKQESLDQLIEEYKEGIRNNTATKDSHTRLKNEILAMHRDVINRQLEGEDPYNLFPVYAKLVNVGKELNDYSDLLGSFGVRLMANIYLNQGLAHKLIDHTDAAARSWKTALTMDQIGVRTRQKLNYEKHLALSPINLYSNHAK